jgi:hypothetical protein
VEVSFIIRRIRDRDSVSILGLPRLFDRERRRQNKRKPARCQATTVSGLTITRTWLHAGQRRRSRIQKIRSWIRSRGVRLFSPEDTQLLTQSKDLETEVAARAEESGEASQQVTKIESWAGIYSIGVCSDTALIIA